MTPEEFRRLGHQIVDRIADYRATVAQRPVMARTAPGEIKAALPADPPLSPEPFDAILADLDRIVMPGLSHCAHPSFFGYFPCNGELSSVLGDYLSTGLGVLGLSWQSSPALTEVEEVVTDWMRRMTGLSPQWSGVIQDTASNCTLVALLCARERATGFGLNRGGLQAEAQPLVVYTSAHSHSSVDKAALLAGFGRDNVRHIPNDEHFALLPNALEDAIRAGESTAALLDAFLFLGIYMRDHFHDEEVEMERLRCSEAELNRRGHQRFLATFQVLNTRLQVEGPSEALAQEVHHELAEWFVHHILLIDVRMAKNAEREG